MNRRLTPRGRERRRQLMDYAATRFAESGYHPTSVAEIVQGLGVGKGVFYWYFSSKEELFLEILRDAQRDLRKTQQAAIGEADDAKTRIELGIRATMQWSAEHRELHNLFQAAATEERFAPALRRGGEVAAGDVIRILKEGMAAGEVRDGDPVLLAHAVFGVTAYLARVFIHEQDEDPGRVADECVAFCLEGLLLGSDEPAPT
ncbi:MAG: TetR/AcrR family transcriptional regulator [Acidimicrobiia bacterium]|nr:TetR/AcrR family transcriptional regulator [Acidimicrobiia bacterium]